MSRPVTQETVLNFLKTEVESVSFDTMIFRFILDEERQYKRLERTLEKLVMQKKVEVHKSIPSIFDLLNEEKRRGSMFRFYKFTAL